MAALLQPIESTTRYGRFSVSNVGELDILPTCTSRGAVSTNMSSVAPVCAGSIAFLTDGSSDTYVLDGFTNKWIKTSHSGGGGGDDEPLTPEQMAHILDIINGNN